MKIVNSIYDGGGGKDRYISLWATSTHSYVK